MWDRVWYRPTKEGLTMVKTHGFFDVIGLQSLHLHCIVIYYHKGLLAFKVLPFSLPTVNRSQSIRASEDC